MRKVFGILSLCWKVYIGIIFLITALFFYPIIFPFLFSLENKKRSFRIFVVWSWTVRIFCGYFVRKEHKIIPPKGPYLIVANHISYLDIFLMYSILPNHPFLFLGKSEILRYPLIKTYFKRLNIPVYRENRLKAAKSLIHASREVKNGWGLVIFPEGKIPDENPQMARFKGGAFQLAKNLAIPIVPLTFLNNHLLFSDPTLLLGPARPGVSRVYMHAHITPEEIKRMTQDELAKHCQQIIEAPLLKEYPELKSN